MRMPNDEEFERYKNNDYQTNKKYNRRNAKIKFSSSTMTAAIVICACLIATIVLLIVALSPNAARRLKKETQVAQESPVIEAALPEAGATNDDIISSELEFWDEYKEDAKEEGKSSVKPSDNSMPPLLDPVPYEDAQESEINESNDGKHTLITRRDGSEEWIRIDPYLAKHEYDFSNLVYNDPIMKYYEGGKKHSSFGVDISKANGTIDFERLKRAGAEFCIIRIGTRGYGSGEIKLDEMALININGATAAGLAIGVDFVTQAVNELEAREEAAFVAQFLTANQIVPVYPVVCHLEAVVGDTARTDALTKDNRSKNVLAFVKALGELGFKSCVYGDKEWLLTKINQSILSESSVWLSQPGDMPDFPYRFNMWQYSLKGKLDGVTGEVGLNVSFVDYSLK